MNAAIDASHPNVVSSLFLLFHGARDAGSSLPHHPHTRSPGLVWIKIGSSSGWSRYIGTPAVAALSLTTALVFSTPAGGAAQKTRQGQEPIAAAGTAPVPLAFIGVTIVDVENGRLLPDQTVVVIGNRMQTVGSVSSVRPPKEAQVVEGRGRYLMPGLWDMHIHVFDAPDLFYPLLVANGVTGVREMSQVFPIDSTLHWRREIVAGTRVGPRVIGTGGFLYGALDTDRNPTPVWNPVNVLVVATPDQARRTVDSLRTAGVDFIKFRDFLPRDVYFAVAAEARRLGLPFVGHPQGTRVPMIEASDSGQRSVEHINDFPACLGPTGDLKSPGLEECKELAARFTKNQTWFTPTIIATLPLMKGSTAVSMKAVNAVKAIMAVMRQGGVPLLAGSDAGPNSFYPSHAPGFSLHDELACMVEFGLTPAEALRTATVNAAKYLNATDSLGTIEAGKAADLVLLEADPLADIHHTMKIGGVVANGRYFDRAALDALVAGAGVEVPTTSSCDE